MAVEAIKAAIQELSEPERQNPANWFDDLEEQAWDAEIERGFSPGGRDYDLLRRITSEIDKGNVSLLKGGLSRE